MNDKLRPACLLRQDRQPVVRDIHEETAPACNIRAHECGQLEIIYPEVPGDTWCKRKTWGSDPGYELILLVNEWRTVGFPVLIINTINQPVFSGSFGWMALYISDRTFPDPFR